MCITDQILYPVGMNIPSYKGDGVLVGTFSLGQFWDSAVVTLRDIK